MLLCPWDSPGKNTGVCCHFILQGSSQPKGWTRAAYISYIVRQILYHWSTWEAHCWPYQVPKCTSYSLHLWKYQPLRMFCMVSAMSGHPVIRYFLVIYKIYCLFARHCWLSIPFRSWNTYLFLRKVNKSYVTWQLQILYCFSYIDMSYVFPKIKIFVALIPS